MTIRGAGPPQARPDPLEGSIAGRVDRAAGIRPFTTLTSVAAPMPDADIDTDIVFPARFLTLTEKTGLGGYAFFDQRFDADGAERPGFVLNRAPWRGAAILVAGPNFGCGSSREQAPWALLDLGVRCIVAPGFGEIFRANCVANGVLPVVLSTGDHAHVLAEAAAGRPVTVDLAAGTVTLGGEGFDRLGPNGFPAAFGPGLSKPPSPGPLLERAARTLRFELPPRQREALLAGLDEIDLIRARELPAIAAFEAAHRICMPWLSPEADAGPR